MPRARTPHFVAEFTLHTTPADESAPDKRLNAARNVYNASLGESLRRLDLVGESVDWRRACAMPSTLGVDAKGNPIGNNERLDLFEATCERFGFMPGGCPEVLRSLREACWIGDHIGSHDMQSVCRRAFNTVEQYALGRRGRPRFKGIGRIHSIEGKSNDAVIRYRPNAVPGVHYAGLVLPPMLDRRDRRGWQAEHWRRRKIRPPRAAADQRPGALVLPARAAGRGATVARAGE